MPAPLSRGGPRPVTPKATEPAAQPSAPATTGPAAPAGRLSPKDAYASIDPSYTKPSVAIGTELGGYRWKAEDLDAVMHRFGIGDAVGLVQTAIALDAGDRYLSVDELMAAAKQNAAYMHKSFEWSPTSLEKVMNKHGITEETALLKTAQQHDNGNRFLSKKELEAAAKTMNEVLRPNDLSSLLKRIEEAKANPNVRVEELGQVDGVPVSALHFASTVQPPKVRVLVTGCVHGNEPCGAGSAALLMAQLQKDPRLTQDVEFTIVPVINPRGMAAATRRTPEDVDLNRVFTDDAHAPHEVQLLGKMLKAEKPYDLAIDLHGGKSKRDGFFALHRESNDLLEPAFARFKARWPVLHRDTKPYNMPTPGIGASDHGNTLKDYAMIHGAKSSLTLEAPGSISYMDQVLGQTELLHEIVNQARVAATD